MTAKAIPQLDAPTLPLTSTNKVPVSQDDDPTVAAVYAEMTDIAAYVSQNLASNSVNTSQIVNSAITSAKIAAANVLFSNFQALAANSIMGRAANSSGTSSSIPVTADDQVLVSSGTGGSRIVNFGTIATGGITDAAVTLPKLSAGITPSSVIKFSQRFTTVGGAVTEAFTVTGALTTDDAVATRRVAGVTPVNVINAIVSSANTVTVTFSANPSSDTQIYVEVKRAAA